VLDLYGALASVEDRSKLWIAPWDDHTNALGHRLLAEKLVERLVAGRLVPAGPPRGAVVPSAEQESTPSGL
jgi:hypothetical protein